MKADYERLSGLIEPAAHLNLTEEQWNLVRTWPVMLRQVAEREAKGFRLTRMIVNGASFVGNKKLLTIQSRVFYQRPDGFDDSYHVNFMPDAAALLVVFKTNGKALCSRKPNRYVLMIEQPRFGSNAPASLDIPAGMLDDNGTLSISSWEKPGMGALRECLEETRLKSGKDSPFPVIDPHAVRSLGDPVSLHPAISEVQHQFYVELNVSRTQITQMRSAIKDEYAGDADERIRVHIEPFERAYKQVLFRGNSAFTPIAMARYMEYSRK